MMGTDFENLVEGKTLLALNTKKLGIKFMTRGLLNRCIFVSFLLVLA